MYEYRAEILRVVDGDTVNARVDLGFDVRFDMKLRLLGINAPELNTEAGKSARTHLSGLIIQALTIGPIHIRTVKDRQEKYGRYLATLLAADDTDLNAKMVADGYAVVYMPSVG